MDEKLTHQQLTAVKNRGGKLLVSAAAGSGKTKVLVDRLLDYLSDPNDAANIDDFLIITYTKAAAAELRSKIAAKLSERIAAEPENRHLQRQIQRLFLTKISTIHSFCGDILREYAYMLDIPADFRVADESECMEIQIQAMEQVLESAYSSDPISEEFVAFVDSQGYGRDDRQIPEIILKVYNSARCHLNPNEWLDWCNTSMEIQMVSDAGKTIWGTYLIEDLKSYLTLQIGALESCISLAEVYPELDKPVMLLQSTLAQLQHLQNCDTWDEIVNAKEIDYGRMVISKKCPNIQLGEEIKAVREGCKNGLKRKLSAFEDDSKKIIEDLQSVSLAVKGVVDLVKQFEQQYTQRKKSRRVLDFNDLEHLTLDLIMGKRRSGPTVLAREIGLRYREIMIDEYQDTNEVQDQIFATLTRERLNCFMVGDVKQSIYQFRLADPEIFVEKYNRYVSAEIAQAGEGRKVILSHNFRSAGSVIGAVNDVFQQCMSTSVGGIDYTDAEMLREGIPHISVDEPEVELYGISVEEDTYFEEATFVANRITELLRGNHMIRQGDQLRPIRPEDIVILLRSPGSVGDEFRLALERAGIPCIAGNGVDLMQTEEVSVLCSLLQIISNPVQDIPLIAVLLSRVFAFTADELAMIRMPNKKSNIYEAVKNSQFEKCRKFLHLLEELHRDSRLCNLPQLIQRILAKTKFDSIYAAMPDGDERVKNIQAFCQMVTDHDRNTQKGLDSFLDYLETMRENGVSQVLDSSNNAAVTIMSVHKSKGLEFPVVFLCGLSRSFNHENAYARVLCDKDFGLGLSCMDRKNRVRYPSIAKRAISAKIIADSISEEMRVLYVAMTRPKDRLIMTYAVKNLDEELREIVLRSAHAPGALMTKEVTSPGEWILQTALKRTEAGEFFRYAGCMPSASVSETPWKIQIVENIQQEMVAEGMVQKNVLELSADTVRKIKDALQFSYDYSEAAKTPSKLTATQLKGRSKDAEVAEFTNQTHTKVRTYRKPSFIEEKISGREYGNAIHTVMQYINYTSCKDEEGIRAEINRLVSERLISEQYGALADPRKIAKLFTSQIGYKMINCENVLREFKFSILEDSAKYMPQTIGEKILLQGVIDCAIIEETGITVIDFKTDFVTEDTLAKVVSSYTPQVSAYAHALQRIYDLPVIQVYLYFFHLDRFVAVRL